MGEENKLKFDIDMVLEVLKDMFTYTRYIIDTNTAEIKTSKAKITFEKFTEESIKATSTFDDVTNTEYAEIPSSLIMKAIEESVDTGLSLPLSQTQFSEIIDEYMIKAFRSTYGESYTTLLDIFKNSLVVISDHNKKPMFVFDKDSYIFDFDDHIFDISDRSKNLKPISNITIDVGKFYSEFKYCLCGKDESFLNDETKIYLNFYTEKFKDRIYCFELEKDISETSWEIKTRTVEKDNKTISIYQNNTDSFPALLMSLSNVSRQKTFKASAFID